MTEHLSADETRVSTHWGVAHNYPERHRSVMQYDDEESAREMAPLYGPDACVVRCTVTTTPWERVDPAPGCNPIPCPNCSATLYTHHHTECPRWGTEPPWEPLSRDWQLGRDDSVSLAKAAPPATEPAEAETPQAFAGAPLPDHVTELDEGAYLIEMPGTEADR